jgi:hypothetical protein
VSNFFLPSFNISISNFCPSNWCLLFMRSKVLNSKVLNAIVSRITYPIYKSDWRIDPCIPMTRYTSSRKKSIIFFSICSFLLLIFLVYSSQDSSKKKNCAIGFSFSSPYIYIHSRQLCSCLFSMDGDIQP